jgi:hypothetical protein
MMYGPSKRTPNARAEAMSAAIAITGSSIMRTRTVSPVGLAVRRG